MSNYVRDVRKVYQRLNDLRYPQHKVVLTNDIFNNVRSWAMKFKDDSPEQSWKGWIELIRDSQPNKILTFQVLIAEAEEQQNFVLTQKGDTPKLSAFSGHDSRSPGRGRTFNRTDRRYSSRERSQGRIFQRGGRSGSYNRGRSASGPRDGSYSRDGSRGRSRERSEKRTRKC
eukprot:225737-Rhodomonas_salina.1